MKRFLAVGFAVLALALSVIVLDAPAKFSRPIFSIPNTVTHFLTKLKTSFFEAYDPAQSPDVSLVGVSNHHATSSSTHTLPTSGAAVTQAVADPEALGAMTSAADLAQLQTLVNQTFQSYIATGKLIGPQGSQGPQGIQGPQGPPGSAGSIQTFGSGGNSNDTSGTILGVTELSARDLTVSNNTALNNLTVSGSFNASSLNLTNALTVSNGGTGDSTLAADGILYGNGTSGIGVTTAGNLGDCLQSNGAGNAPTFGSCTAGGARWDQLLNPNTNLALFMTANTTTLTYGNATGVGTNLFNLTDTASNTGTGYLLNLSTAASSTLNPLQVVAAGRTALTVDAGGNVGIGTNSPVSVLEVNQSSAAKNSVMILSTTGPIIAPRLVFNRYSSGQPADNNMWDFIFGNISFAGRVVNDSDTVASSWISATRTGLKVNDVTFFGGNVRIGTAVFATANLEVNGSQPASSDGANGANIGNTLIIDKVTGGDTSVVSTGAGGNGSAISVSSGNGGQALSAGTASTGGGAGTITLQGGTGGAAAVAGTGNNTGGTGGPFTWTAGTGGAATGATSGNNTGGNGGAVSLQGGTGGAANAGTGNLVGGTGGSVTISGGTGGVGLTSGGNGGLTTIQGGTAAAMAGAAGGGVTLTGKAGSSTGAGGAGGTLTLTAGAAGGNNSVNRAGGAISLTVGASKGPSQAGGAVSFTAGAADQNTATGTQSGPIGGGSTLTLGAGGTAPSADVASTGGKAGTYTITGGTGGAAAVAGTGTNNGGVGSAFTWTAGTGGAATGATSGINTGGAGGAIALQAGTGGTATTGSGTLQGGGGGIVSIIGGSGAASNGAGGNVYVVGGVEVALRWHFCSIKRLP